MNMANADARKRIEELGSMEYGDYLKTSEWKDRREAAIRAVGGRCQLCNDAGALNVHHKVYDRRGCELPSDLFVLCAKCHEKHHGKESRQEAISPAPFQVTIAIGESSVSSRGILHPQDTTRIGYEIARLLTALGGLEAVHPSFVLSVALRGLRGDKEDREIYVSAADLLDNYRDWRQWEIREEAIDIVGMINGMVQNATSEKDK
jgi:hypothetical protein